MPPEESLKDYDPAKPIHPGWDTYRYAPKEICAGVSAESSLERAMRLRREFLDALKECGATAAQDLSLFELGGDVTRVRNRDGVVAGKYTFTTTAHVVYVSFFRYRSVCTRSMAPVIPRSFN